MAKGQRSNRKKALRTVRREKVSHRVKNARRRQPSAPLSAGAQAHGFNNWSCTLPSSRVPLNNLGPRLLPDNMISTMGAQMPVFFLGVRIPAATALYQQQLCIVPVALHSPFQIPPTPQYICRAPSTLATIKDHSHMAGRGRQEAHGSPAEVRRGGPCTAVRAGALWFVIALPKFKQVPA